MKDMTFKTSPFEHLQASNSSTELWWDSSPLVFAPWRDRFISSAPNGETAELWRNQIDRFFNPDRPTEGLVRGVTTNPSLIASWIQSAPDYWRPIINEAIAQQHRPNVEVTYCLVYQAAITRSAEAMVPLWTASEGKYGWVSAQTDPRIMFDEEAMFDQALAMSRLGSNVMIKIPGTPAGYRVIENLTARGISTNSTLSYTVPQFMHCIRAVERGLARAYVSGVDTSRWRNVITHMIGRFGAMNDLRAEAEARDLTLDISDIRWAEIAILKRGEALIRSCGHPSKMLLSSLKTDWREIAGSQLSMHLEHTSGADIAYTCKPDFLADVIANQDRWTGCSPDGIHSAVPEPVLDRLMLLPSFRKAYEPDGLTPLEFSTTGAFLGTYMEVNQNIQRLIHHIGLHFERHMRSSLAPAISEAA